MCSTWRSCDAITELFEGVAVRLGRVVEDVATSVQPRELLLELGAEAEPPSGYLEPSVRRVTCGAQPAK